LVPSTTALSVAMAPSAGQAVVLKPSRGHFPRAEPTDRAGVDRGQVAGAGRHRRQLSFSHDHRRMPVLSAVPQCHRVS